METSGSLRQWIRKTVIHLIRCPVVKRLVEALTIVKPKPVPEPNPQLGSIGKGSEIEILMFERPPQPLDKNVVLDASATVHTDGDAVVFQ